MTTSSRCFLCFLCALLPLALLFGQASAVPLLDPAYPFKESGPFEKRDHVNRSPSQKIQFLLHVPKSAPAPLEEQTYVVMLGCQGERLKVRAGTLSLLAPDLLRSVPVPEQQALLRYLHLPVQADGATVVSGLTDSVRCQGSVMFSRLDLVQYSYPVGFFIENGPAEDQSAHLEIHAFGDSGKVVVDRVRAYMDQNPGEGVDRIMVTTPDGTKNLSRSFEAASTGEYLDLRKGPVDFHIFWHESLGKNHESVVTLMNGYVSSVYKR